MSDFDLEVNVTGIQTTWRFLADTPISKSYVASFMSYRIHNLGLPHCQPSRVTTIHRQPFTSNKKTVKGLTCFVVSLT